MSETTIEFDEEFRTGNILEKSNKELQQRLMALCTGPIPNEQVRHREIIRGITINHILLQKHIDGLNKQNNRLQKFVVALVIASLMGTGAQIYIGLRDSKRSTHIVREQVLPKSEAAKSRLIQDQKTMEDQKKIPSNPLNTYAK